MISIVKHKLSAFLCLSFIAQHFSAAYNIIDASSPSAWNFSPQYHKAYIYLPETDLTAHVT